MKNKIPKQFWMNDKIISTKNFEHWLHAKKTNFNT